ncbi:MAG: TIGR03960 family B12-binding radical SAM protein [Ruminococcaceae bacterium]|nr:TIGR03960 family B12-binding radical SAM protein [Oscillospiraceae bacterium]
MDKRLERILPRVQKPARYVGGEYNAVMKDKTQVDTRVAFCFPDTYEIGMSNLGMRILYGVMNNMDGVWCERCFHPWGDMEEEMRRADIPLYALESSDPIGDFDVIAFSVGYEMAFPAMLNMLDLARVPIRSADRPSLTPLVVAGGTAMYNCEPIADFIDLALLGEGEDQLPELLELHRLARREGWDKQTFLRRACHLEGVYVPSLYDVSYHDDGTVAAITPKDGAPARIRKRIVTDMDKAYYPAKTIVPSTEIVQDRITLELFRGCIRGCRFCQAGYVYRPVRPRSRELCAQYAREAVEDSGYQEMTLSSLSTSDYRPLVELCDDLEPFCERKHLNLSLPSLRADNFSMALMERLQKGRKTGLTFAPEAGTQRLRGAINKNLTEEDLLESCRRAFAGGYSAVKLYFMLGLPTETDEDVIGIADVAAHVMHAWRESAINKARGVRITVSTSWFVPKPHTAFQWEPQIPIEEYERRVALLRERMNTKTVTYNWHPSPTSFMEAVISRGDRRMCAVMEEAHRRGAKLDAWEDYFSLQRWLDAFAACGIDPHFYANRRREHGELMPWSHIDVGVTDKFLMREHDRCYEGVTTPDCRTVCSGCGANSFCQCDR